MSEEWVTERMDPGHYDIIALYNIIIGKQILNAERSINVDQRF